jgi:hypothetical protein
MKAYLYIVMIGCAGLWRGIGHAGPSSPTPEPSSVGGDVPHDVKHAPPPDKSTPPGGKSLPAKSDNHHAAANSTQNGPTSGTKLISPSPLNPPEHSEKPEVNGVQSKLPSTDFKGIGKLPSIRPTAPKVAAQNNRAGSTLPPSPIQPAGALLTDVHNHGPAPAAIGGPASSKVNSTAAINGTTVTHKP